MNTKFLAPCLALVLGFTLNVASANSDDVVYAADDDISIVLTGSDHEGHGSNLSALELHEADDEVLYGDDDISIVLTGAR